MGQTPLPPKILPAITGMGCVSPLGCGLAETAEGLRSGRDGISEVELFPVSSFQSKTAGQVREEWLAPWPVGRSKKLPRATKLLWAAVREALAFRPGFQPDIVIAGTTSGGMDFGEQFFRGLPNRMKPSDARRMVHGYVPQQPISEVLNRLEISAPVRVVSNACASGTNALCLAAGLIRSGRAGRVMAVGYDALCELVFAGFDALRASTPEKCRPFDAGRSGLALGEGAACFLLEPDGAARAGLATVPGWGFANDNHHLTQPEPGGAGPRLSMSRAFADAGWQTVDYINAHGTGTPFNDASEACAVRDLCPNVPVSSTKGMTGHALGAAGAIEAAFCVIAMREGFLPPNINLRTSDSGLNLVENLPAPTRPHRVASNSFGFGGSNATVLLEAVP